MKRFLFLILLCTLSTNISAQEADSLKLEPINIDSLAVKLDKLQHDYVLLYCNYELDKLIFRLENMSNRIDNTGNVLLIYCEQKAFDIDFYISIKNLYDAYIETYEALEESIELTNETISNKITSSNIEAGLILGVKKLELITSLKSVQSSLNRLKKILDTYKDLK